ncbi:hypothetical protein [Arthrobacter sp. UCD-GKA]|uniref:hypothetical protein n=1 Tax=Arthrobacter sp. UCD-GKA TaxID=1913576 RepID=UPI001113E8CE|nr:hypothetical protein [Arthrobacter sp. UCD-GKA]
MARTGFDGVGLDPTHQLLFPDIEQDVVVLDAAVRQAVQDLGEVVLETGTGSLMQWRSMNPTISASKVHHPGTSSTSSFAAVLFPEPNAPLNHMILAMARLCRETSQTCAHKTPTAGRVLPRKGKSRRPAVRR